MTTLKDVLPPDSGGVLGPLHGAKGETALETSAAPGPIPLPFREALPSALCL